MDRWYQSGIRYLLSVLTLTLVLVSCQKDDQSVAQFLESLPHEYPEEINRFQQADSLYFGHLGYKSIPRDEGSLLLYDRNREVLLQTDQQGNLKKLVARTGKGPGEVLDINAITKNGNGGILLYDQKNKRMVEFDEQLEYLNEYSPTPFEGNMISKVYPASANNKYMLWHSSYAYLRDKTKQPHSFLTRYNADTDTYEQSRKLQDRRFARLVLDGEVRGGTTVLFSSKQLIVPNPLEQTLYTYWTDSDVIAEISSDFDTLKTISVELPSQPISQQERDSLKEAYRSQQWNTLGDLLPEQKVPVEEMKIDSHKRLWLKLNYRGNTSQWLIMDQQGESQKVVHLPKESMLTHVTDHHLGVRLDDITFALFESVK
jgi:hypothetical protein